ncbi:hypothetical protein I3843_11G094000 [Carya illinoinensis]|nr:hypothetical protein I3843_11G094000 [Carya illinoinensis]
MRSESSDVRSQRRRKAFSRAVYFSVALLCSCCLCAVGMVRCAVMAWSAADGKARDRLLERVQRKSHRQVDLISLIPKPKAKEEKKPKEKEPPKPEEKKEEVFSFIFSEETKSLVDSQNFHLFSYLSIHLRPLGSLCNCLIQPQIVTVVLKVHMHCDACAQEIKKCILKMNGMIRLFFIFTTNAILAFTC